MQNLLVSMGKNGEIISSILIYVVVIGGMYLFLFKPQQKKKKQEEELRSAVAIGDEITTIGGIMGRVVSIKNDSDSLVIETASEKIKIKKWAIASIEPSK